MDIATDRKKETPEGRLNNSFFLFRLRLARIFTIFFLRTRTTTPATALFPDGFFLSSGGGGGSGSDGGGGRGRARARDKEESQKTASSKSLGTLPTLAFYFFLFVPFVYILAYTYYFTLHDLSDSSVCLFVCLSDCICLYVCLFV